MHSAYNARRRVTSRHVGGMRDGQHLEARGAPAGQARLGILHHQRSAQRPAAPPPAGTGRARACGASRSRRPPPSGSTGAVRRPPAWARFPAGAGADHGQRVAAVRDSCRKLAERRIEGRRGGHARAEQCLFRRVELPQIFPGLSPGGSASAASRRSISRSSIPMKRRSKSPTRAQSHAGASTSAQQAQWTGSVSARTPSKSKRMESKRGHRRETLSVTCPVVVSQKLDPCHLKPNSKRNRTAASRK